MEVKPGCQQIWYKGSDSHMQIRPVAETLDGSDYWQLMELEVERKFAWSKLRRIPLTAPVGERLQVETADIRELGTT